MVLRVGKNEPPQPERSEEESDHMKPEEPREQGPTGETVTQVKNITQPETIPARRENNKGGTSNGQQASENLRAKEEGAIIPLLQDFMKQQEQWDEERRKRQEQWVEEQKKEKQKKEQQQKVEKPKKEQQQKVEKQKKEQQRYEEQKKEQQRYEEQKKEQKQRYKEQKKEQQQWYEERKKEQQ
nr:glutamic acid-rich protein-like [Halyomorpha halys]